MQFHCSGHYVMLRNCRHPLILIFYDPSDTFLRHTCEKHDDKASPHGECSPFIEQRVMERMCLDSVNCEKQTFNVFNMEF